MKKTIKWIFAFLILISISYISVAWYFSTRIVDFRLRTLEEDKNNLKIESIAEFGLPQPETVEIPSQGIILKGWYFENPQNQCAIVFHHGITGTRFGSLKYTRLFKDRPCHFILFDARHHGESKSDYGTYGYYEKFDTLNVIEWVKHKTELKDSQIGLVGESFGAATVIQTGGLGRNFWFILADSPYSSLEKIIKERAIDDYSMAILMFTPLAYPLASFLAEFEIADVSPKESASSIKTPIFIVHSIQDKYTLPYHSKVIYQNITIPRKKLLLTDWNATHGRSIDKNFEAYYNQFSEFLNSIESQL